MWTRELAMRSWAATRHGKGASKAPDAAYGAGFDAAFLRHHEEVYRLLYRITGSADDAEDLVQEVFLRLFRQERPPGDAIGIRAWLLRVATNLAYNWVRDRARRERRDGLWGTDPALVGEGIDPATEAARRSEVGQVRRTLASIPERQSLLLLLRYGGLSYREVASVLGVATGSVGTMLARAEAAFEAAYRSSVEEAVKEGAP